VLTQQITILNKLGLHARAASVFVKTAGAFASEIKVTHEENEANGKSIMSMMMLAASCGTDLVITVEGEDEEEAMTAIADIINNRFGEAE